MKTGSSCRKQAHQYTAATGLFGQGDDPMAMVHAGNRR